MKRNRREIKFSLLTMLCLCGVLLAVFLLKGATEVVAAEEVKLSKKKVVLEVGDTYQLTLKGTDEAVAWKSKKKSVVTVDQDGTLTAKKPGKTKIIAKVDGEKYKCKVTVKVKSVIDPAVEQKLEQMGLEDSWKQELYLAAYMGLPMEKLEKETITGKEMAELLDALIAYEVPKRLSEWKTMYPSFRSYEKPLPRIDVQSILFLAAQFIGGAYTDYEVTVDSVNRTLLDVSFGETDCAIWELYGKVDSFDNGAFGSDHFGVGGTFYNNVSISPVSGEQPLSYDEENNAYHMKEYATYLDGVMAIARVASIVHVDMFAHIPSAEEQKILDQTEMRKEAIMNTESDWTLGKGGKVYYISPDGDDSNDGLSPETAWKTLGKLNSAAVGELNCSAEQINTKEYPQYQWAAEHPDEWITLNPGDVVLFERGGVWRGGFVTAEGVTYSAYGEGAKPEILGSPENGSGAEKWSLLEGTENIWVYYREIQECGGILLNGTIVAGKYAPFWDEDTGKWLDFGEMGTFLDEEMTVCPEFDVKALENLCFFNDLQNITPEFPAWCWGTLYLRCDEGNPGAIYDSIEFFSSVDGSNRCIGVAENATIDNLSFKYLGSSVNMKDGATVRNCWIEYCGGIVLSYNKGGYTRDGKVLNTILRCGECITAGNSNTTVTNTYMAYAYDGALSVENGVRSWLEDPTIDVAHRNVYIAGNIMAYSGGGFGCGSLDAVAAGVDVKMYENIQFVDNYVLYTGMGWSHQKEDPAYNYQAAAFIALNPGNTGEVHLVNNVFYDCQDIIQLVNYEYFNDDKAAAEFRNNTYVADAGARVANVQCSTTRDGMAEQLSADGLYLDNDLVRNLIEYIGEQEPNVIKKRLAFVLPQ